MSIRQLRSSELLNTFINEARQLRKAVNTSDTEAEQYHLNRINNLRQDCFFNLSENKINGSYVRCPVLCLWFINYCDNNNL